MTTSSTSSSTGTCDITAIGTCMENIFNTELLLGQTLLDNSNGAFSTFITIASDLITGMETLTGSSTATTSAVTTSALSTTATTTSATGISFIDAMGVLAIVKDLLGVVKTFIGNSPGSDSIGKTVIQLIRLTLDSTQYFLSLQNYEQDPSNVANSLWIVKSEVSIVTSTLSFMDNLNDVGQYFESLGSVFMVTNPWAKDLTFKQMTLFLRMVDQAFGGVIFIMYLLKYKISLSSNTGIFMLAYIGQRAIKIILFILKYSGITSNAVIDAEGAIFGISALLNLAQLYFG